MTVQEQTGRVEVLSDLYRAQLATVPPEVPVETWVPPLAGPGYWDRVPPAETLALHDRIIVHSGFHIERLLSRGIPREKIELRPLAPLSPAPSARASEPALRQRVAMIADLPASDAASLGIELPTHQAVFAAAVDLITADYLAVHPGMAPDLLRRALARAGVDPQTQDTALQDSMLRIVRDVLIPALPPLILADALASHGIPLTLIGDWPGLERRLKGKVADNLAAHCAVRGLCRGHMGSGRGSRASLAIGYGFAAALGRSRRRYYCRGAGSSQRPSTGLAGQTTCAGEPVRAQCTGAVYRFH